VACVRTSIATTAIGVVIAIINTIGVVEVVIDGGSMVTIVSRRCVGEGKGLEMGLQIGLQGLVSGLLCILVVALLC
jgi:hypothetical protein